MKVDNAIIMAAGTSSRFAPISLKIPKAFLEVKGEILIERQIRQLKEAGIDEIVIVIGYKKELFYYLKEKFGVILIENPKYNTRNNNYSLYVARDYLKNTYICSADNYFVENVFNKEEETSNYSVQYNEGYTDEWCVWVNEKNYINKIKIGGEDTYYLFGHAFFSRDFSNKFKKILEKEVQNEASNDKYWEDLWKENLKDLPTKIKLFKEGIIEEFDSLEELRKFDKSYIVDTRSELIKEIVKKHNAEEKDIVILGTMKKEGYTESVGFKYNINGKEYCYYYKKVKS